MTTAKTKPQEGLRPFVDYETVDGDGHTVLGSYDWWKPYLPKKYWDWAPKPIREPNQEGNVLCEGRVYRLPMPYPGSDDKSSLGGLMTPGGWQLDDLSSISIEEGRKAGGADPHDRLKAMDADKVSIAYLYPSEMLSLPWALLSSSFAMALARAYNDWLIDYCATDPHRLRGAAVIPQQDLVLALEEVERVRKLGMATIMLRPNLIGGITFEHPNYEPIWAAAQDMDMGIGVHEGFGVEMPTIGWDRTHNWMQAHALQHPAEHMAATLALITGGVFQRYPKLRIGFLENGAGWAPFWLHHMDEHYEKWHRFYPGLDEKPSFYFKRQCFLGVEPDYELIPHLVDSGLAHTLVFSTDFPHFDAIYPGSVEAMASRDDMTPELKRQVLRDNALRLYGASS